MKKLISVLGIFILIVLIAACSGPRIVCNKPYIRVGTECCLDYNSNAVCDKDESMIPDLVAAGSAIDVLDKGSADPEPEKELEPEEEEKADPATDIMIDNVYWNTINIEKDTEAELTIEFKNRGTVTINNFDYIVKIYKGTKIWKEDTYEHSEPIAPDEKYKVKDITYTFDEEGTFKAKIYLEGSTESKETSKIYVKKSQTEEDSEDEDDDDESPGLHCSDTDDGRNFIERGTCKDSYGTYTDTCERENLLSEYYCEPVDQECHVAIEVCNCQSGKCIS